MTTSRPAPELRVTPDLRTAKGFRDHISEQLFSVKRQPIIELQSGAIHHYEWLVRFDHATGVEGVLRPAEINGVIKDLDLSMLAQAILVLNAEPDSPGIAINLSGASVDKPGFMPSVLACLSAFKAAPSKLVIELTETWDMHNLDDAENLLMALHKRGHPICLDDVGAGAASIRYLRALPADWLKIDGDFVVAALKSEKERAILQAILSLRDALGCRFIAEGIENEDLLAFAKAMNFDAAQGYAIGKPEPESRIS